MQKAIVTGAFGFTGRYITQYLLEQDIQVETLSNSTDRIDPFNSRVYQHNFSFDDKKGLIKLLKGKDYLFNTYWVRFNHKNFTFREAINNSRMLFEAAHEAGIKKVVHISVSNPHKATDLEYFSGKLEVENTLIHSGLNYTILRPALIYAQGEILINNIAWCLRTFPFFLIPGDGNYKISPIFAPDVGKIAIQKVQSTENEIINLAGPETYTYNELIQLLIDALGIKDKKVYHTYPFIAYYMGCMIGVLTKDTVITKDEIKGLMQNMLYLEDKPLGQYRFSEWVKKNKNNLGIKYFSEMAKRKYKMPEK